MNEYMRVQYPYKHVRRPPRCTCPDCTSDYATHNRDMHCDCQQCIEFREAGMPAPATTSWQAQQEQYERHAREYRERVSAYPSYPDRISINAMYGKTQQRGKPVSNMNICDREGCNAIIKGNAAASLDFWPNALPTNDNIERKHLCPPCAEDIDILLHTPPLIERERGYDKPYKGWESREADSVESATAEQLAAALFQKLMKQQALEGPDAQTE